MNEFYPLDFFLHFKKSDSYPLIFLKNEKFKKSPFCKLQKSGSEAFRVYRSTNDFTFSNPQVIQEQNEKVYDDDVLNDGNNYAYRIYKNVPTEGLFFYHTDHLMTPLQMTDENQNIVWQAEYYPFGRIYSQSGDIENNLRFPGQYSESDLNFYYNWHRYYFYKIGRYNKIKTNEIKSIISEDIYPYVWANPIIHMDLNGLYGKRARNCINSIGKGGSDEEPYAITVCDGCDGFEWRWLKKPPCAEECYEGHEKAHIEWFEKNKPDACKGRSKGSNPLLGPGDKEKTECYAYKYSSDCMERWRLKSNMPGYTSECKSFVKHNYNLQIKNRDKYCKKGG